VFPALGPWCWRRPSPPPAAERLGGAGAMKLGPLPTPWNRTSALTAARHGKVSVLRLLECLHRERDSREEIQLELLAWLGL
jgi:hypothetical protein